MMIKKKKKKVLFLLVFSFLISSVYAKGHNFTIAVISGFFLSMLTSLIMVRFIKKLYRAAVQKYFFFFCAIVVLLCLLLFLLLQRVKKHAGNSKPVSGYNKH